MVSALAAAVVVACERPPSADSLQQWTSADHHSNDDNRLTGAQAGLAGADEKGTQDRPGDVEQLVELAWRTQCATCHGPKGHGDGQMGPMVQAPDLTRGDWQSNVSDAEMASTIKRGKNRMPAFDLPDAVLAGLVKRVRTLRGR